jgi:hypothetical protein
MRIGNLEGEIPDDVKNLGFSFGDEMVLLGFTLSSVENMSLINFNPIIGKLQNSIRYWERFYLSLPGKITVYKCLLLSQLSYKASILKPDQNTVRTISDMFEKFILNGMTFSKDRLYRPVRDGGLGLIPLEQYIQGLHCSWFKRAYTCMNDNWKYDLHRASNGSILDSRSGYLSREVGTVLTDLVSSYTAFLHKFTQYGNTVPILNNSNFGYGRNQSIKIDATFFGQDLMLTHYQSICTLTWKNCTINGSLVSIRNFNAHTGILFTREQYYDLKTAHTRGRKKFF